MARKICIRRLRAIRFHYQDLRVTEKISFTILLFLTQIHTKIQRNLLWLYYFPSPKQG